MHIGRIGKKFHLVASAAHTRKPAAEHIARITAEPVGNRFQFYEIGNFIELRKRVENARSVCGRAAQACAHGNVFIDGNVRPIRSERLYELFARADGVILFGIQLIAPHSVHGNADQRIFPLSGDDFIV